MSLLVIFEILGLFVNTLTVIGKHSLPHTDNLLRIIQMYLSMKQKVFSQSLAAFGKSNHILNILKKKMTLVAHVFPTLRTANDVVK